MNKLNKEWKSCGKNMDKGKEWNNEHLEYYNYLKKRTKIGKLFRHHMFSKSIREFEGKVLDVGCGIGEFGHMYDDSVSMDVNEFCVEHCDKAGLVAVVGDIHKIPFKDKEFDGVFCSNVLEHIDMEVVAIREMNRVLTLGGKLIIHVPLKKGYATDPTHKKFYGVWTLQKLLQDNGFANVKYFYMPINSIAISGNFNFGELVMIAIKVESWC